MQTVKDIVLVLGAGASNDHGYPLGGELAQIIIQNRHQIFEGLRSCNALRKDPTDDFADDDAVQASFKGALESFRHAGFETLDAFLSEEAAKHSAPWLALAIAWVIHEREKNQGLNASQHHWHRLLMNALLTDRGIQHRFTEGLGIITFNYDRSVEISAASIINGRKMCGWDEAVRRAETLPIIHLHGKLTTPLQFQIMEKHGSSPPNPRRMRETAQQLGMVCAETGNRHGDCKPENVATAREWLRSARVIAFMGFGFHRPNCSTLGINSDGLWCPPQARVFTTYMGDEQTSDYALSQIEKRIGRSLALRGKRFTNQATIKFALDAWQS